LESSAASHPLSLGKVDENLLHILDVDGRLMPGNSSWSYTLNRISERP